MGRGPRGCPVLAAAGGPGMYLVRGAGVFPALSRFPAPVPARRSPVVPGALTRTAGASCGQGRCQTATARGFAVGTSSSVEPAGRATAPRALGPDRRADRGSDPPRSTAGGLKSTSWPRMLTEIPRGPAAVNSADDAKTRSLSGAASAAGFPGCFGDAVPGRINGLFLGRPGEAVADLRRPASGRPSGPWARFQAGPAPPPRPLVQVRVRTGPLTHGPGPGRARRKSAAPRRVGVPPRFLAPRGGSRPSTTTRAPGPRFAVTHAPWSQSQRGARAPPPPSYRRRADQDDLGRPRAEHPGHGRVQQAGPAVSSGGRSR